MRSRLRSGDNGFFGPVAVTHCALWKPKEDPLMRYLIGILIVLAAPAFAEPVVYDCRTQQKNYPTGFWSPFDNLIQPQIVFTVDGASATIEDGLTLAVAGGPIPAESVEDSDKKLVVKWRVVARGRLARQATMTFRAAFLKPRNELIVTQAVTGNNTTFHARGACNWPGIGQG